jgi:hypothetical protein
MEYHRVHHSGYVLPSVVHMHMERFLSLLLGGKALIVWGAPLCAHTKNFATPFVQGVFVFLVISYLCSYCCIDICFQSTLMVFLLGVVEFPSFFLCCCITKNAFSSNLSQMPKNHSLMKP